MKYGIICNNNNALVVPVSSMKIFIDNGNNGQVTSLPLINIVSGKITLSVAPNNFMKVDDSLETALDMAASLVSSTGDGVVTYYDTTKDKEQTDDNTIDKKIYHVDNYGGLKLVQDTGNKSWSNRINL